jgi:hypothetical protein
MSLQTLKRRVQKLEAIRAQKSRHVVVVFLGTTEADEQTVKLIEQGRLEAERLGKELQVIQIGWFGSNFLSRPACTHPCLDLSESPLNDPT